MIADKKNTKKAEVGRGSVYRKRERVRESERGSVLKWSSCSGSCCIVISEPVQSEQFTMDLLET